MNSQKGTKTSILYSLRIFHVTFHLLFVTGDFFNLFFSIGGIFCPVLCVF